MNDSIENDGKFVRLLGRLLYENRRERTSEEIVSKAELSDLTDLLVNNRSAILEDAHTKTTATLKHLFKYIDRRVERAVLEERKVQHVDKLQKLYEKFDEGRNNEKLRLDCNGNCVFNFKELPLRLFDDLNGLLIQEIIKIDPALLMIKDHSLGFEGLFIESVLELEERTIVVFFRFDGMRLELRFKSNNGLIEISLPEIAKYFSDEVNKIVCDKYAPK